MCEGEAAAASVRSWLSHYEGSMHLEVRAVTEGASTVEALRQVGVQGCGLAGEGGGQAAAVSVLRCLGGCKAAARVPGGGVASTGGRAARRGGCGAGLHGRAVCDVHVHGRRLLCLC